jgi:hypothetical protein
MMVAILVLGYVLVLRYLDQKNRKKDRLKLGNLAPPVADYEGLKKALAEMSHRLADVESQYREVARRVGVTQ